MVQPVKNWEGNDLAFHPFLWTRCLSLGNLLTDPLMGPRLIEIFHVFSDHPIGMLFAQDQDAIKAFPSHTAQKSFTNRIRFSCPIRCFQNFDRRSYSDPREDFALLTIASSNQETWSLAERGCFAQLLRRPGVRR
jgi:hypothetical protein